MDRFFLKDRCALPNQMSFLPASSRRTFVLAKRDRNRANENQIAIFVFNVTAKDFPHGVLRAFEGLPITLLIGADKLCIGQYVALHCSLDLRFGRVF